MTMNENERLTLAGLHVTIGLAMAHDEPFEFCCPVGSTCGQFKYCSVCSCFVPGRDESDVHDVCWWMNELKKYEEHVRDGRDHEDY